MANKDDIEKDLNEVHNNLLVRALELKLEVEKEYPANNFPSLEEVETGEVKDGLFDGRVLKLTDDQVWRLHRVFHNKLFDSLLDYVKHCCGAVLERAGDDSDDVVLKCLDLCKYLFDRFQLAETPELAAFMPDIYDGYEKILLNYEDEECWRTQLFYRIMFELRHVIDGEFSFRHFIECIVRSGCKSPKECTCTTDGMSETFFDLVSLMVTRGSLSEAKQNVRSIENLCAKSGNCLRWRHVLEHVRQKQEHLCVIVTPTDPDKQDYGRCTAFIADCDIKLAIIKRDCLLLDRKRKRCEFMRAVAKRRIGDDDDRD